MNGNSSLALHASPPTAKRVSWASLVSMGLPVLLLCVVAYPQMIL